VKFLEDIKMKRKLSLEDYKCSLFYDGTDYIFDGTDYIEVNLAYVRHFFEMNIKNSHTIAIILTWIEKIDKIYRKSNLFVYFQDEDGDKSSGWFPLSIEDIGIALILSEDVQTAAIKVLKEKGLIEVNYKGLPRKRFIRLNLDRLEPLKEE
jgi:hypothetical protein